MTILSMLHLLPRSSREVGGEGNERKKGREEGTARGLLEGLDPNNVRDGSTLAHNASVHV